MDYQGSHTHTIDPATGRVALPSKFRKLTPEEANGTFVITMGDERCLCLYPLDVWEKNTADLKSLSHRKKFVRTIKRKVFGTSERVGLDEQGRIAIPKSLVKYAQIENEVVIVGVDDVIEIWNPELFQKAIEESQPTLEEDWDAVEKEIEKNKNKNDKKKKRSRH